MITGRSALRMRAVSACSDSSDGLTRVSTRVERPSSMPASALRMSPGSEMNTGPVGGVVAILAARRTIRGRSSSRVTSTAHFTSGSRHLHQRAVEHRLRQAVALLLLAGGQDQGRAGEAGVVERAHRVAEARRDMDVAGDELARGAAETVGHGDDKAFLHRHHIGEVGMVLQRMHDRQFGGAGIAEQMRDALVFQQCKECGAAGDLVFHVSSRPPLVDRGIADDQT